MTVFFILGGSRESNTATADYENHEIRTLTP